MAKAQTDNSAVDLKVQVREWVLARLGLPDSELSVLDLYCGERGEMFQGVWRRAGSYLGCDKNHPHKLARTIKAPAELAVQQLPLDSFNCFDLDCYDSPWVVARRLLRRRAGGRFGLVLTSGEGRALKNGDCNEIIRATIGASKLSNLSLMIRYHELITGLMVASLAALPRVRLEAGIKGEVHKQNIVKYVGLIVDKAA
jgi:hypothetical protein